MNTTNHKNEQSGIIIIFLLFAIAIMIFGYVVINSIIESKRANQVKDSATQVIDTAKDSVDAVNQAKDKAQSLIGN